MCSLSLFISLFQLLPDFPVLAQFIFFTRRVVKIMLCRITIDLRPPLLTFIKRKLKSNDNVLLAFVLLFKQLLDVFLSVDVCSSSIKTYTYFLWTLHVKFSRQSFRHSCECTHVFTALDHFLILSTLALVSKMFIGFGGNGKKKCGPKVLSMGTYLHMRNSNKWRCIFSRPAY